MKRLLHHGQIHPYCPLLKILIINLICLNTKDSKGFTKDSKAVKPAFQAAPVIDNQLFSKSPRWDSGVKYLKMSLYF